jgi:hypothetical protein
MGSSGWARWTGRSEGDSFRLVPETFGTGRRRSSAGSDLPGSVAELIAAAALQREAGSVAEVGAPEGVGPNPRAALAQKRARNSP